MNSFIDLENPISFIRTATKFSVSITNVYLNISCSICVMLYDAEGCPIDSRRYNLEGQEYTDWTNDQYIFDYVQRKLNEE